jgi:Leucine-rich repeat (LRR) protein
MFPIYFKSLSGLDFLDITFNFLSSLCPLGRMISLKRILLNNNWLNIVDAGTFDGLKSIQTIELSSNKMVHLQNLTFNSLSSLLSLNLQDNSISLVEIDAFINLPLLTSIKLGENMITRLLKNNFHDLPSVQFIELFKNPLNNIDETPFIAMNELKRIDMTSCFMETIGGNDTTVFSNLPKLESIALSGSKTLSKIYPGTFFNLPNLKSILIIDNSLTTILEVILKFYFHLN